MQKGPLGWLGYIGDDKLLRLYRDCNNKAL